MNYLQLCQATIDESGIATVTLANTSSTTGDIRRICNWVTRAIEDIYDKREDWDFFRTDFTISCVSGTATYASSGVTAYGKWKLDTFRVYNNTIGLNDEQYLIFRDWENFRDIRLLGPSRSATGRPTEFSIKPDQSIVLWPIPNSSTLRVNGEYFKKGTPLVIGDDTLSPAFDRFHMAIVYNALMRYAAYNEEGTLYASAQKEYNRLIAKIERNWMMDIGLSCALC